MFICLLACMCVCFSVRMCCKSARARAIIRTQCKIYDGLHKQVSLSSLSFFSLCFSLSLSLVFI